MLQLDAPSFLQKFAVNFSQPEVQKWTWGAEENDFGKSVSWDIPAGEGQPKLNATIDLQLTQLALVISEHDDVAKHADATIVFNALIQFEDGIAVVDGLDRAYSEQTITDVIAEFHQRTL